MSFVDRERRASPASIAGVVLVHVAVGVAIVNGLAIHVFTHTPPPPTVVTNVPIDRVPPPKPEPTPHTVSRPVDPTLFKPPVVETGVIQGPILTWTPPTAADPGPETVEAKQPPPPAISHRRGEQIIGNRAQWVTTEDYPSSSIRAGTEGTTAILVTIGIDGRVTDCRVTGSSGDVFLDQVACKVYSRRARFNPALDDEGRPMIVQRADRVRWQLPKE